MSRDEDPLDTNTDLGSNIPAGVARRPSIGIIGTRGYPSYYGGFETAVRKLAPYLSSKGWDVTVYSRPNSIEADDPDRDARVKTVITKGLDWKSLSTLSFGLTSTLRAVRSRHDVVVVMNVANGFWLPLLKIFRIPTLVNVDGIEWERAKWGKLAKLTFRTGAKLTALLGDRLVFDSIELGKRWRKDFNRDGAFIPYGGDPVATTLPLEPGLEHRKYVLLVARFVPENTILEFFDAVPKIAQTQKVVIVGSSGFGGEIDDQAKKLADTYENVKWLGHLSDDLRLHSLWQHAGVYFHGHSVGGTNPALVQAMACGAPTVARDTPFNREVLGEDGVFVEPVPDVIASEILKLLGDRPLLAKLSKTAQSRAATIYSWESVNQSYHQEAQQLSKGFM